MMWDALSILLVGGLVAAGGVWIILLPQAERREASMRGTCFDVHPEQLSESPQ